MGIWPLAEPPKSYILFAAMSMMGGILGRSVYFGQDFRRLYPMLNLLLIGPSGIGKSTAIEMAEPLVYGLPKIEQPQIIKGTTPEKLHADLLPNPHAFLIASELANFFNKQDYNSALVPYVTELLDYKPVEKRTKGGGTIRIEEPTVTVIGGSTVDWLQGQLPDAAVAGGFLARFLIVGEEHKGQSVASPEDSMSVREFAELQEERAGVFADFHALIGAYNGQVRFKDYGALDAYTTWYSSHSPVNGHLAPFAARANEFVKRLSIILALSACRHQIIEDDIECAIKLYKYTESKLQEIVVPMSASGKMLSLVMSAIGQGASTEQEVCQAMRNYTTAQETSKFLTSLITSGDLKYIEGKFVKA
jgi:hypothetical protein